jgi:hypothetical protein
MDFADGRHPQFLVEARLFKNERRTFLNARQKSGTNAEVFVKPRFETGDFTVCLVDTDSTGNLLGGVFSQAVAWRGDLRRNRTPEYFGR